MKGKRGEDSQKKRWDNKIKNEQGWTLQECRAAEYRTR